MNRLTELFSKLNNFLCYKFMGIDLCRIGLAAVVFILLLSLRGVIRNCTVKILRKLISKVSFSFDENIVRELKAPFDLLFFFLSLWLSFYILGLERLFLIVNNLERIILIFIVTWALYRVLNVTASLLRNINEQREKKLDNYIIVFAENTVKTLVLLFGTIMCIQELGYDVTGIVAGLGIGGLAFALAGKDFVANIFGFITIFMDKPFTVGDYIVTPDVEGTVEDIWLRCTKIRSADQSLVTIPNSVLAAKAITNKSLMKKKVMTFKLGLLCSAGPSQINELCIKLREMLGHHEGINGETIHVYFTEFGESSFNIFLYFFTNTTLWNEYLEIQHDVNLKIMNILDELSLELAYPSRSIYIEKKSLEDKELYKTSEE